MTALAPRPTLFIVCPTEYGGHIEHAAELAAAASRSATFEEVVVISREGAAAAVGTWAGFTVAERLRPRRTAPTKLRPILQFMDTISERVTLRRMINARHRSGPVVVLHETTKHGLFRGPDNIVFVHNAKPHDAADRSLRGRLMMLSQRAAARWASKVVVHGERQARLVSRWTSRRVISVPLPGSTLDRYRDDEALGDYILCLGEVRPDKGIDVAISAAQIASLPLIIAGAPEPADFGLGVTRAASVASSVELRLWFQSDEEFAELMRAARVVLLPYMHFDAQSGVLARAMHLSKRIVASDLSSLREQAGDYPHITFVRIGDTAAWAHSMEAAFSLGDRDSPLARSSSAEQDWDEVASTIFG